jgi:hypothetical protein
MSDLRFRPARPRSGLGLLLTTWLERRKSFDFADDAIYQIEHGIADEFDRRIGLLDARYFDQQVHPA